MVSIYEYQNIEGLEARSGIDYSVKLAKYTDTIIKAQISQAERLVNTKCNTSFTGTIPDAVVYVTTELAYRTMYNMMIWDGPLGTREKNERLMPLWDETWDKLLKPFLAENAKSRKLFILN